MLYRKKSFTVPATAGDGTLCREKGHSARDARGRCMNCGERADSIEELTAAYGQLLIDQVERESERGFEVLASIAEASSSENSVVVAQPYGISSHPTMLETVHTFEQLRGRPAAQP